MATAKWATPSAVGSNIAGTTLNSLANASTSTFVEHDNSSNLDLYASVRLNLGSITPTTGGSVTLRVFSDQDTTTPDATGSVGGGDTYTQMLTTSTSAKVVIFPMIRLYPEACQLCITNNSGVTFNSANNELRVRPFNEAIA